MINTYISVQKEWVAGRGFNNVFTITFTLNGSAFNISAYTFAVAIRRIGGETNVLSLTQSAGITNGGATGILTIQVTEAQTETIDADSYFYSIDYTVGGLFYSLFHGTFNLLKEYNPNTINNSVTVPVSLAGTDVNASVTLAGSALLTSQSANRVLAGPTTGSAATPTFRALVEADIPTINTRSISTTTTTTLTPNIDLYDLFIISAQSTALHIDTPTGTPVLGNGFMVDIEDNGSIRLISYTADVFEETFVDLPTQTVASKRMKMVFQYNGTNWDLLNVINEQ